MRKLLLLLPSLLFLTNVVAQDLSTPGLECLAPTFSKGNIEKIIEHVRIRNPSLPPKIAGARIIVKRQRCHYIYEEWSTPDTPKFLVRMALITEYGRVITFIKRNSLKNLVPIPCQKLKHSKKDLARFLENSRLRYRDLPKRPDKYTSKAYKLECAYTYYEISGQGNKGYGYEFDFYGDLIGFSPISIKSPVLEGQWHLTEIY